MSKFYAPSSYGEALDRLTILELKLQYIEDGRREDVQREYDELKALVAHLIEKDRYHYERLLEVNHIMWEIQNILHGAYNLEKDKRYFLMEQLAVENQRRFRIKRTMNEILGSHHKEQKGYKGKKAFLLAHQGMGDIIFMNSAVRFLATNYDEVKVVVKKQYLENARQLFSNEPSVTFFEIQDDKDISPLYGAPVEVFKKAIEGYEFVGACGYHKQKDRTLDIPLDFYKDLGPEFDESMIGRWSNIPYDKSRYAFFFEKHQRVKFFHNRSSNQIANISVNLEECLVINPAENMYDQSHKWYKDAQQWVGLPLLEYCSVLEKAEQILVVDSSFFCLALMMGLKPEVWTRNGRSYKSFVSELVEHPF